MEKEAKESRKAGVESDHVWIERERRKKMKDMFCTLHALLSRLPAKYYKWSRPAILLFFHCTVVDEAVRYIKSLDTPFKQRKIKGFINSGDRGSTCSSMTSKTDARTDVGVTKEEFLADHFQEDRPSKKLAVRNTLNFQQACASRRGFPQML